MQLFQRLWGVIKGSGQSTPAIPDSMQKVAPIGQMPIPEIELVPTEKFDPYQDHTHQPHCSDHFLFTKDCALCQEIMQAQPPQAHPSSRSFGFTDNITTTSLTSNLGDLGATSPNAALQTLPEMLLKAEVPYHSLSERFIVNSGVDDIVDTVETIEIDNMGSS
jgi:hypothetical protein